MAAQPLHGPLRCHLYNGDRCFACRVPRPGAFPISHWASITSGLDNRFSVDGTRSMERYKFVVLDGHNVNVLHREFVATSDEVAIQLASGWIDVRGGQVWRDETVVKLWDRIAGPKVH